MSDWVEFYDSAHSIYVNARHKDVHYRDVAKGIAALAPGPQARVLDYGCGEAVHADFVAACARELILSDAAPTVRRAVAARFAGHGNIRVISTEEVETLPDKSLDLIVANSLVQYLDGATLDRLLRLWRRLLTPGGALVIADVIPPHVGTASDVLALLRYAARNGFLGAALIGLVRTAFSPYRKLRAQLDLARYTEAEFLARLTSAGFKAERLTHNLEHNPQRMTFMAHPSRTALDNGCARPA